MQLSIRCPGKDKLQRVMLRSMTTAYLDSLPKTLVVSKMLWRIVQETSKLDGRVHWTDTAVSETSLHSRSSIPWGLSPKS